MPVGQIGVACAPVRFEILEKGVYALRGEAMRFPTFVDNRRTSKVLEHGFAEVPRLSVTAQSPVEIERCKECASAALLAVFVLLLHRRFIGPVELVESL